MFATYIIRWSHRHCFESLVDITIVCSKEVQKVPKELVQYMFCSVLFCGKIAPSIVRRWGLRKPENYILFSLFCFVSFRLELIQLLYYSVRTVLASYCTVRRYYNKNIIFNPSSQYEVVRILVRKNTIHWRRYEKGTYGTCLYCRFGNLHS